MVEPANSRRNFSVAQSNRPPSTSFFVVISCGREGRCASFSNDFRWQLFRIIRSQYTPDCLHPFREADKLLIPQTENFACEWRRYEEELEQS